MQAADAWSAVLKVPWPGWTDVNPADRDRLEPVLAWGTPMLLDTSYRARPTSPQPPPTLAELRAALIAHYPQVGPIFA